jgi:hypothetical protein
VGATKEEIMESESNATSEWSRKHLHSGIRFERNHLDENFKKRKSSVYVMKCKDRKLGKALNSINANNSYNYE